MPLAFNLSQDQTLQFNLCGNLLEVSRISLNGIERELRDESRFPRSFHMSIWVPPIGLAPKDEPLPEALALPPKRPHLSAVDF